MDIEKYDEDLQKGIAECRAAGWSDAKIETWALGFREGVVIGYFKGLKHGVIAMMENFGVTAEEAIATLELSPEDSKRLAAMIG